MVKIGEFIIDLSYGVLGDGIITIHNKNNVALSVRYAGVECYMFTCIRLEYILNSNGVRLLPIFD